MTAAGRLHELQVVDDDKAEVRDAAALGVHVRNGERRIVVDADIGRADGRGRSADAPPLVRRELAGQQLLTVDQTLTRQQRVVFDDALYIDLGGEASEYTAASNGKLAAYMMMHELDFVVTSDEVLEYYKDTFPMEDLEALLPADLREALADKLSFNTDADGKTTAIALDMTHSRFVAGTGADADPNVQHTYYFFVPAGAPHPEQIVQFLRYSFGL